jgi:uncharacterized membrane protein
VTGEVSAPGHVLAVLILLLPSLVVDVFLRPPTVWKLIGAIKRNQIVYPD